VVGQRCLPKAAQGSYSAYKAVDELKQVWSRLLSSISKGFEGKIVNAQTAWH
jgi:hypothetical protein